MANRSVLMGKSSDTGTITVEMLRKAAEILNSQEVPEPQPIYCNRCWRVFSFDPAEHEEGCPVIELLTD